MPLPVAHALIGASIVAASREKLSLRKDLAALLLGASVAVAPDFDLVLSWLLGYNLQTHGGFSHSILVAAFIGFLASLVMRESFLVYSAATLSHAILDAMVKREFGGVQLLWPFATKRIKLGLIDYFEFYPAPGVDPIGPILKRAFEITGYEAMIFLPVFILAILWRCRRDASNCSLASKAAANHDR